MCLILSCFTYVVASAATIVVADRAPAGAEHLRELLVGVILWVTCPGVAKVLVTSLAVGGLHVWLGRRFVQISGGQPSDRAPSRVHGRTQISVYVLHRGSRGGGDADDTPASSHPAANEKEESDGRR